MFKSDYKWQHDYVRLAVDTGFCFERHKSSNFDQNKISSIDIERIIEERDLATIDRVIPTVIKFTLDSEQARILDQTFVKTFLLSQLCIQYLLFCKKYLDNTLTLVKEDVKKVKEENAELNLFVDDLKSHIDNLMKEIDSKSRFKCTQCNKIFSTEEFLSSHIKRRHSLPVSEEATDKLQMEIKELKGRLNNAEKAIQKETTDLDIPKDMELKKIEELQQKFEDLRLQVQSELKILQTQHNFQEKYEKWFEKMALEGRGRGSGDVGYRREITTQTEIGNEIKMFETDEEKNKENIPEVCNAQKQIVEFGEALETKVASSLEKIENQMQSFWNKLNDMERQRRCSLEEQPIEQKPKPMMRARTKLSLSNNINQDKVQLQSQSLVNQLENKIEEIEDSKSEESSSKKKEDLPIQVLNPQKKLEVVYVKEKTEKMIPALLQQSSSSSSSETVVSETEISAQSTEESRKPAPQVVPTPKKRQRKIVEEESKDVINDNLLKQCRVDIEKVIEGRLQDLGVSPEWRGLPTRSFQRAMEIVNHQASLTKKNLPNFDYISTQIEKNVSAKLEKPKEKELKTKLKKVEPKFVSTRGKAPSPKIEIKNRKMYESDSDSDIKPPKRQFSTPYSAVIEELKAKTLKIDTSDKSDENIIKEVKNEDPTKGVLKSYPSVGSLTKKKVLFNLDVKKDGGSTTSVASSVFDNTPREKKDKDKDIEDLSDFDFSDM